MLGFRMDKSISCGSNGICDPLVFLHVASRDLEHEMFLKVTTIPDLLLRTRTLAISTRCRHGLQLAKRWFSPVRLAHLGLCSRGWTVAWICTHGCYRRPCPYALLTTLEIFRGASRARKMNVDIMTGLIHAHH